MNSKFLNTSLLPILAVVFTIGLTFASIELPRITDNLIGQNVNIVNVYTGGGDLQDIKTELFIQHFHLRTIGYICLTIIVALIIIGFLTERTGLTSLGAFAIFLPVFGHFAATMFFLGGLGFLRLLWLPGLDISFNIMKAGDAVFIPYRIILDAFNLIGINLYYILPYIFIALGLLIFCIGTLVWFNTYYKNENIARFWFYKYSRHPQYLGWIIWSYGILFLPGVNMKQSYSISDSLPWLLSTLIIIGVAMLEEIKMSEKYGKEYEDYRKASYFMIPFPTYFCKLISAPFRVFFNKSFPTRKREIIIVLSFYLGLIILLTIALNSAAKMEAPGKWIFDGEEKRSVEEMANIFVETPERRDKYHTSISLIEKGDSSIPYLLKFLSHPDFVIREFSADALGILKPKVAIYPLIESLNDNNSRVVSSVIRSLGNFKSNESVDALIDLLNDDSSHDRSLVSEGLIQIGTERALNSIIPLAEDGTIKPSASLINALKNNRTEKAEKLIIKYISDEDIKVRQAAVIGAMNFDSNIIKTALSSALNDKDWEVRLYAEEVLKIINSN